MALSLIDLPLVTTELTCVQDDWLSIGLGLKIDETTLKGIQYEGKGESGVCLKKMVSRYLKESSASWNNIANALDNVGKKDIAQRIRISFLKKSVPDHSQDNFGRGTDNTIVIFYSVVYIYIYIYIYNV